LFWPKGGPTMLQKFQIKFGWKELEIKNNFPYRNFSRFEMKFELKLREALISSISLEIHCKNLKTLEFDEICLPSFLLHLIARKKWISSKRGSEIWIPIEKGIWIDFAIVWILNLIFKFHF
jgi:hypothetical protein